MKVTIYAQKFERDSLLLGVLICRQLQLERYPQLRKCKPTLCIKISKHKLTSKKMLEIQNFKRLIKDIYIEVSDGRLTV
jgi:hypothetical protein